jgi:hypothetical protein
VPGDTHYYVPAQGDHAAKNDGDATIEKMSEYCSEHFWSRVATWAASIVVPFLSLTTLFCFQYKKRQRHRKVIGEANSFAGKVNKGERQNKEVIFYRNRD